MTNKTPDNRPLDEVQFESDLRIAEQAKPTVTEDGISISEDADEKLNFRRYSQTELDNGLSLQSLVPFGKPLNLPLAPLTPFNPVHLADRAIMFANPHEGVMVPVVQGKVRERIEHAIAIPDNDRFLITAAPDRTVGENEDRRSLYEHYNTFDLNPVTAKHATVRDTARRILTTPPAQPVYFFAPSDKLYINNRAVQLCKPTMNVTLDIIQNDWVVKAVSPAVTRVPSHWKAIKRAKKRSKGIKLSTRTPTISKAHADAMGLEKALVKIYDATVIAIYSEGHKVPERKKLRSTTKAYIEVNIKLV